MAEERELLVDGMNVIGSRPDGWWRDRDAAVRRLLAGLQRLALAEGRRITVVFDGRPLEDLPAGVHDGVEVRYAARAGPDAADDVIVALVAEERDPAQLEVVTSDRGLRARLEGVPITLTGAGTFRARLPAQGADGGSP